jgi:hypothetical protein
MQALMPTGLGERTPLGSHKFAFDCPPIFAPELESGLQVEWSGSQPTGFRMTGTTGKPSVGCEHGRKGTMYNSGSAANGVAGSAPFGVCILTPLTRDEGRLF